MLNKYYRAEKNLMYKNTKPQISFHSSSTAIGIDILNDDIR